MASYSPSYAATFCRATSAAVVLSPSIVSGKPQQVCSIGNSTSTPAALNTFIAATSCSG